MVYVLNIKGQPLMPTSRHSKVKHLLKQGKAKVVKRCPFVILKLLEKRKTILTERCALPPYALRRGSVR